MYRSIFRISTLACLALLVHSATDPSEQPQELKQVTTLRTARAAHTATTLESGHVLLAGGITDGGGSSASAELFDPGNNTVTQLGSLSERRAGHTATALPDGRILIAGGYNGEYLASLEVFEPKTKRFHPAGSLVEGRSGHTATLLPDGRVLFIGGIGRGWTFLRSAELYDPATSGAEPVGPMSVPRESHTATLLADGSVLIVGGHSGRRPNVEVYGSAELFSARSRRFESAGTLATARHKHDAIKLEDGRVFIIGGADRSDRVHFASTEIYNPHTGAFSHGPTMTHRRYKIAGTTILLPGGDVLVTSGALAAERLDADRWTFREIPGRLPAAYRFAAAARLRNGGVVIAGGYSDSNQNTAGVWRFDER
jgi:hypothetical protein